MTGWTWATHADGVQRGALYLGPYDVRAGADVERTSHAVDATARIDVWTHDGSKAQITAPLAGARDLAEAIARELLTNRGAAAQDGE